MWGFVLLLGIMVAPDPIRIGIAVFLISRPRPMLNLVTYWLGGLAAGIGIGFGAVLLFRDVLPGFVHHVGSTFQSVTGGHVQLLVGVLALSVAAVNAKGFPVARRVPVPIGGGNPSASAPEPRTPTVVSRLLAPVRNSLEGGHPWVAFVVGLGQATPPVEYLMVLSAIVASGAAIGAQLSAVVAFTLAVFVVVEIPLVAYLVKPAFTETMMLSAHNWLRAHRRPIIVVGAGTIGVIMVANGLGIL